MGIAPVFAQRQIGVARHIAMQHEQLRQKVTARVNATVSGSGEAAYIRPMLSDGSNQ
jgi:hypothetical protein